MWTIKKDGKDQKLKNPILIQGLPGIGNVGKVVADFLVDELKAKKYCDFLSNDLPASVFVNENNIVELPKIEMYYKKGKRDMLMLIGDIQPQKESSCYELCHSVLSIAKSLGCKEIVTLGGIGLGSIPDEPAVFITGNDKDYIKKFKSGTKANEEIFGIVGPILGVSGVLVGLAKEYDIKAVCLLAETLNHPMFLGIKGSQKILEILNKKFSIKINIKKLDKEIDEAEKLMVRAEELAKGLEKLSSDQDNTKMRYIG